MSPWPRVVIQGVFVKQENGRRYLLCSRFISENCIVPPFGEQVMECWGKQRDCSWFLTMQHNSSEKGSHIPASLSDLPTHYLSTSCLLACMTCVNLTLHFLSVCSNILLRRVLQTGAGAYGRSLLKSLNIHRHGSLNPCTVKFTCMTILWCGEALWGHFRELHAVKCWEKHALNEVERRWLHFRPTRAFWDFFSFLKSQLDCANMWPVI